MRRITTSDASLAYVTVGSGEPVVCIHGAFIADTFLPLLSEPALTDSYQIFTYHRRGYGESSHGSGLTSMAEQAADCRTLLQDLAIDRAHVIGHSLGGCIALQLALDAPEMVHSLALLEPGLMVGESADSYRASLAAGRQHYHEVGPATAVDEFLEARWPEYHSRMEEVVPGAFDQAVADAATCFDVEIPSLVNWDFGESEAARISKPVLSVLGAESEALWPRFGETHRTILTWWPHAEGYVLPRATHFLQIQNPRDMAQALAAFFARHPIEDAS